MKSCKICLLTRISFGIFFIILFVLFINTYFVLRRQTDRDSLTSVYQASLGKKLNFCFQQPSSGLNKELAQLVEDPGLKNGHLSFTFLDPAGKEILSWNPHKALMPASTLKVITTSAALELLSDTLRIPTILAYTGKIEQGVLKGNLLIKGGGDPTLGSFRFPDFPGLDELISEWVKLVHLKGITRIEGNVCADPSVFNLNTVPPGWIWTDIGNYYGAGASGLNINENQYKLVFKPQQPGESALLVRTEPDLTYMSFLNQMKTGKPNSGDQGYIFGGIFSNQKYLSGTVPAGVSEFSIKGAIPDPAYFSAWCLKNALEKDRVSIHGKAVNLQRAAIQADFLTETLDVHFSPPLSQIVQATNHESINLYAEALLNLMGAKIKNEGSTAGGLNVIYQWLNSKDIPSKGIFLYDGSGLSPSNAICSQVLAKVLLYQGEDKTFIQSLPVAGESGTLKNFCKGSLAEKKIIAKSGSFEKVMAYCGFVKSHTGKLYPFSLIINNYSGQGWRLRRKVEKLMEAMTAITQ